MTKQFIQRPHHWVSSGPASSNLVVPVMVAVAFLFPEAPERHLIVNAIIREGSWHRVSIKERFFALLLALLIIVLLILFVILFIIFLLLILFIFVVLLLSVLLFLLLILLDIFAHITP